VACRSVSKVGEMLRSKIRARALRCFAFVADFDDPDDFAG